MGKYSRYGTQVVRYGGKNYKLKIELHKKEIPQKNLRTNLLDKFLKDFSFWSDGLSRGGTSPVAVAVFLITTGTALLSGKEGVATPAAAGLDADEDGIGRREYAVDGEVPAVGERTEEGGEVGDGGEVAKGEVG